MDLNWKQFHIKFTNKISNSCGDYYKVERSGNTKDIMTADANCLSDDSIVFSEFIAEDGKTKQLKRVIIDKKKGDKNIRVSALYL